MVKALTILEEKLPDYIIEVKQKHSENAKGIAFSNFVRDVFKIESRDVDFEVPVNSAVLEMRGRVDAVFGNLLLEFKKDLRKSLEEAKEELIKYFQSYFEKYSSKEYLGIATDGLQFKAFKPIFTYSEKNQVETVSDLEEIDSLDLEKVTDIELIFSWFDSYLFSSEKIIPTSIDIKQRFGVNSPTYFAVRSEINALYEKIKETNHVKTKFDNWSKYLEIVYGDPQKEVNLFIRHTYLSTLVKLIVHIRLSGKNTLPKKDMNQILHGYIFEGYGINNFVEEDFFTWITYFPIREITNEFVFKLLNELQVYDLDKINEDILKELYQELIDPEYRKLLGEFYTPDWLAQMTVDEVLKETPKQSVLDPSCGSGTFLFCSIRKKIKELESQFSPNDLLTHILETVSGFDLHPVAVTIAKTNYLLALKDLVQSKKGPIKIPVYLCDSVKLPSKKPNLYNHMPTFEFEATDGKFFNIPSKLASNTKAMDDIIKKMYDHASSYSNIRDTYAIKDSKIAEESLARVHQNLLTGFKNSIKNIKDEELSSILLKNYELLISLINQDKNAIWTYIIRNVTKPLALVNSKVDVIVGNPPWITMQNMKNQIYQDFLKHETFSYNLINKDETHQYPHMELATLFFCLVSDLYLKPEGKIGFVMPKSILVSSHHKHFIEFNKPKFKLEKIFDATDVFPVFKVPSCVIIGTKDKKTTYPVPQLKIKGRLPYKNASIEEAMNVLKIEKSKFEPASIDISRSPYYKEFFQGATIVPRNFFFVEPVKSLQFGMNLETPKVKSSEKNDTKPPWSDIIIENDIESRFLYGSLLGADIVPFGQRGFRLMVLPISVKDGKPIVCSNFSDLQKMGCPKAAKFFETVEEHWKNNSTEKQKDTSIYQWINYRNKIQDQNLNVNFKVLYVASSTFLASCVVDLKAKMFYLSNGDKFKLNGFVAESKTYYFETNNGDEAHYLCAILNSKTIDDLIKPLQTQGLWGPRDIHKRPLLLPIPKFDRKNSEHIRLTQLSKKCHSEIPKILHTIQQKSIGTIRTQARNELQKELDEINELTKTVMRKMDHNIQNFLN